MPMGSNWKRYMNAVGDQMDELGTRKRKARPKATEQSNEDRYRDFKKDNPEAGREDFNRWRKTGSVYPKDN